jgi:hypothetical protein
VSHNVLRKVKGCADQLRSPPETDVVRPRRALLDRRFNRRIFNKALGNEHVAQFRIEGMGVGPAIAGHHLQALAVPGPGKLFGCGQQSLTDPAQLNIDPDGNDSDSRDITGPMHHRNDVHAQYANDLAGFRSYGNKRGCTSIGC